ncbi:glycoside hydrolase superfamily [Bisporella sp. PMI_857]|nr:glycoside hydrolase superfamily [Bisporella sp. PMI_857]
MVSVLNVLFTAGAVCVQVSSAAGGRFPWRPHHGWHYPSWNHSSKTSYPTGTGTRPGTNPGTAFLPSPTRPPLSTGTAPGASFSTTSTGTAPVAPSATFITITVPTSSFSVPTESQFPVPFPTFSASFLSLSTEDLPIFAPTNSVSSPIISLPSTTISLPLPTSTTPNDVPGTYWKPEVGATWQIELSVKVSDTNYNADVFDFDLFDNDASTIDSLHALGKKAICYFSAGTYEDWRDDGASFKTADLGSAMKDWAGESWVNTNSANVRAIMTARIELAKSKGCDAIDPDNVDAFNNENGLGLTTDDAIDYLTFLASAAHSRGMAIGLKNAGEIVKDILPVMDFQVNEQCRVYNECETFGPFIDAGKPVFHIEYPNGAGSAINAAQRKTSCGSPAGFSTVLKKMELDSWIEVC